MCWRRVVAGLGHVEWRRPPEPLRRWMPVVPWVQGPGVRGGWGAREVQEREAWHDDATPAVLGG